VNNIVAWVVIRLSQRAADREHPYGHYKFETLAVFGLATLLVVLAVELAQQAILREPGKIQSSNLELAIMGAVIIVNAGIATWQRRWARRLNSDILRADASHTFADVMITGAVIVGWQLSAMGYAWLDRACALAVAGLVLYLAWGLFKRTVPGLVDHIALEPEAIMQAVAQVPGVLAVYDVRSRWIGTMRACDLKIAVDANLNIDQSHQIATAVEALLAQQFDVHDSAVHVEPLLRQKDTD